LPAAVGGVVGAGVCGAREAVGGTGVGAGRVGVLTAPELQALMANVRPRKRYVALLFMGG